MFRKILLFIVGILFAEDVCAAGFRQDFDVQIGVFDAAQIVLTYEENRGKYDIAAEVNTANLFDALYPFKAIYKSTGLVLRKKIVPELYQAEMQSRSHKRTKRVFYDRKGQAYKRISTKDKKEKTSAIQNIPPSADMADLQTVFAAVIENFRQKQTCALSKEIYDGKKHYQVVVTDKGPASHYYVVSGNDEPAYKCLVYIKNLKENNDNVLWDVSAEKPINMWIGWDKNAKMPFLIEINIDSTPLGALKVTPRTLKTW